MVGDKRLLRNSLTVDEITVGMKIERHYEVSDGDLEAFGKLSGDMNPLHFDDAFAASYMFGRRIAHGMISAAKFSGIFGMDIPGSGALWESLSIKFLKPVFLNASYKAIALVTSKDQRRVYFDTWVEDADGTKVLEGSSVLIPITERARGKLSARLS
jgi:3-hydroxybutyryl-CoA dehydratase